MFWPSVSVLERLVTLQLTHPRQRPSLPANITVSLPFQVRYQKPSPNNTHRTVDMPLADAVWSLCRPEASAAAVFDKAMGRLSECADASQARKCWEFVLLEFARIPLAQSAPMPMSVPVAQTRHTAVVVTGTLVFVATATAFLLSVLCREERPKSD